MKKNLNLSILSLIGSLCIVFLSTLSPKLSFGQGAIPVPFSPRTTPSVLNVRGDFTMLGNSVLTVVGTLDNSSSNSNTNMRFIDEDNDSTTLNSSMASLVFRSENGSVDECTNVRFAGLYWTGRTSNNDNSISATSEQNISLGTVIDTIFHGDSENSVNLTLNTNNTLQGYNFYLTSNANGPRYHVFTYRINNVNYRIGKKVSGTGGDDHIIIQGGTLSYFGWPWEADNTRYINGGTRRAATFEEIGGNYIIATLDTPRNINNVNNAAQILAFRRPLSTNIRNGNNGTEDFEDYLGAAAGQNRFLVKYSYTQNAVVTLVDNLYKNTIKVKGPNDTAYTTYTAQPSDVYIPPNYTTHGGIYSSFVDVTTLVNAQREGEYWVANVAASTGNGQSIGYYGGWAMVVVYENNKMEYRDISIFDGHAFIEATNSVTFTDTIDIEGFQARQNGPVNVKIGFIAGEGDRSITGDFLSIKRTGSSQFTSLSPTGNTQNIDNFFRSAIQLETGSVRTPSYDNNTGLDIVVLNPDNSNKTLINNSDVSTKIVFGTNQDTYVLPLMVIGIDAYVPDMTPVNRVASVNGEPYDPILHDEIAPRDTIEYRLVMQNTGSETINNLEMKIALPLPVNFLSMQYQYIDTNTVGFPAPVFDSIDGVRGSIKWGTIDSFPRPDRYGDTFAILTYKVVATDDCYVLMNPDCAPVAAVQGYARGVGAISQVTIDSLPFIYGFQTSGACIGAPITTPEQLKINGVDFVRDSCGTNQSMVRFVKCNGAPNAPASVVPISELEPFFPNGSVYSNTYPATTLYTSGLPYPTNVGDTLYYYAIPPVGSLECYFKIMVANYQQPQYIDHDYDCREDWVKFETNPAPAVDSSVIFKILETYRHGLVRDTVDRVNNTGYFTGLRGVDSLVFIVENIACAMEPLGINFELCDGALAVNFQSFTAKKNNSMVALDWTTTNEVGVVAYNVEHSTNSRDFNSIGKVAVSTSTDLVKQYHYLHKNPAPGLNYYRIKENDDQGFSTYSIIKIVDFEKHISIDIFPNPVQEQLNVRLVAEKEEKVNYWIANAAMQQVNLHDNNAYMMTNTTNAIDIADLTSGIYFLMFKLADGTVVHHKFVVDK